MATAQDMINEALKLMAVYAPGETPTDADLEQGLACLNDMLDSWSNESLSTYATLEQTGNLISGVASYTIGVGGAFNMTRPLRIIEGPGAAYTQDVNGNNYQIDVVTRDQWNLIGNRTNLMNSDFVQVLFYDPQFPLGIINVWPFPNQSQPLFWDSYLQLSNFTALTTAVSLPLGYKKALQDNLAVTLWPYFKTGEIGQGLMIRAKESKGVVKRTNLRTNKAVYDAELVNGAKNAYNVYTDSYGTRS